ncbi:MAG: MaoC family dehydratase [Sphingomonadaceae bacterium]
MATEPRGIDSVEIGQTVYVSKTVGESDVYLFAGITGDLHPNHVNEQYMKDTRFGRRIAHGALMVGYISAASTKLLASVSSPCVNYGFERIRFIKPVFIGDTITVEYRIVEKNPEKDTVYAQVTITNQKGEVVTSAVNLLRFV